VVPLVNDRIRCCDGWLAIPQATERQHIGNQINAVMIFAWADFVNVNGMYSG